MGFSPLMDLKVLVSAPTVTNAWFPGEAAQGPTDHWFNERLQHAWSHVGSVSGNLIFIDTHTGSGGSAIFLPTLQFTF